MDEKQTPFLQSPDRIVINSGSEGRGNGLVFIFQHGLSEETKSLFFDKERHPRSAFPDGAFTSSLVMHSGPHMEILGSYARGRPGITTRIEFTKGKGEHFEKTITTVRDDVPGPEAPGTAYIVLTKTHSFEDKDRYWKETRKRVRDGVQGPGTPIPGISFAPEDLETVHCLLRSLNIDLNDAAQEAMRKGMIKSDRTGRPVALESPYSAISVGSEELTVLR